MRLDIDEMTYSYQDRYPEHLHPRILQEGMHAEFSEDQSCSISGICEWGSKCYHLQNYGHEWDRQDISSEKQIHLTI